jgi:hypothetical protein
MPQYAESYRHEYYLLGYCSTIHKNSSHMCDLVANDSVIDESLAEGLALVGVHEGLLQTHTAEPHTACTCVSVGGWGISCLPAGEVKGKQRMTNTEPHTTQNTVSAERH